MRLDVTPVLGEVEGDTRSIISSGLVEAGPDTTPTLNRQAWTKQKTEHPVVRYLTDFLYFIDLRLNFFL